MVSQLGLPKLALLKYWTQTFRTNAGLHSGTGQAEWVIYVRMRLSNLHQHTAVLNQGQDAAGERNVSPECSFVLEMSQICHQLPELVRLRNMAATLVYS